MPAPRNTGLTKRQKERNRQEKQQQKAQKKAERKAEGRVEVVPGEDPDLAGIVPGPQPRPWDDDEAPAETEKQRDQ
ncbi:hypothetical protein L6R52_12855 [Myxococcota bacterium]|nr:hypothetical protein [Myxococcota bacterium]